jgi:hypothetical protein
MHISHQPVTESQASVIVGILSTEPIPEKDDIVKNHDIQHVVFLP